MAVLIKSFFAWIWSSVKERSLSGTLEGILWGFLFLPLLLSYLPVGFRFSLVNFTYGARGHEPAIRQMLPLFLVSMILAMYALEIFFRGFILRGLLTRYPWQKAFWIHLLIVNILLAPLFWKGREMEEMGWIRFFLVENLLESFWALFFLRSGSLLVTAGIHGAYNFGRFVMLNDVAGPFETLFFYSAASDDFYWLILAVTFLAVSVKMIMIRKWGVREKGIDAESN